MKLIIPSANRYKKLARSLEYYAELQLISSTLDIYILDGSDGQNASRYKDLCKRYKVTYLAWNELSLPERLLRASRDLINSDEIFFIGNDEDVFTPSYIMNSVEFMKNNVEYSTYIGKYLTLARPILGLHRVPFERLTVSNYDLDSENPQIRMTILSKLLLVGISPLFYGIRRGWQFHLSCKVFNEIKYGGAGEFADQILLSFCGKIYCADQIMLVRDETKIGHIKQENHQRNDEYITQEDLNELAIALKKHVNIDDRFVQDFATNWMPINKNKNTLSMTKFKKQYSPIENGKYKYQMNILYRIFITIFEVWNFLLLKRELTNTGLGNITIKKLLKLTKAS